jgi:hypothetical protein
MIVLLAQALAGNYERPRESEEADRQSEIEYVHPSPPALGVRRHSDAGTPTVVGHSAADRSPITLPRCEVQPSRLRSLTNHDPWACMTQIVFKPIGYVTDRGSMPSMRHPMTTDRHQWNGPTFSNVRSTRVATHPSEFPDLPAIADAQCEPSEPADDILGLHEHCHPRARGSIKRASGNGRAVSRGSHHWTGSILRRAASRRCTLQST